MMLRRPFAGTKPHPTKHPRVRPPVTPSHPPRASSDGVSAVRLLPAIRRRWYVVAGCVLVAVVAAVAFVLLTPKKYEATADVSISPLAATDDTFQGFNIFRQPTDASSAIV